MKLAVEQGHVDAMFSLAMYFRGDELTGVEKDTAQMTFYLKMAANSCMGKAQRMLGYLYKDGEDGTLKNRLLAMHYFRLAAEQGDKIASFELSALEEEEAEEKALQIKSMPAGAEELFSLGVKYREGEDGFERNNIEALRLFHLSAEQGHSRAIYFLACAYRDGGQCLIFLLHYCLLYLLYQMMWFKIMWKQLVFLNFRQRKIIPNLNTSLLSATILDMGYRKTYQRFNICTLLLLSHVY